MVADYKNSRFDAQRTLGQTKDLGDCGIDVCRRIGVHGLQLGCPTRCNLVTGDGGVADERSNAFVVIREMRIVKVHVQQKRALRRARGEECRDFRSEEHTSELQSQSNLVCRLLLEKKKALLEGASHGT